MQPCDELNKDERWFHSHYSDALRLSVRLEKTVFATQSNFQKIEIFDTADLGRMLVLDGEINVAERDEFIYHEMIVHVPLFAHPGPKSVMVAGGGDGGAVREALKHPDVEHIVLVEIDAAVIDASRRFLPFVSNGLSDPRVSIIHDDAARFLKGKNNLFDVIIIDSTDPIGAGKRLFEYDFYASCHNALKDGGILTGQSESPLFCYSIVAPLYAQAKKMFPIVSMYLACMPTYASGMWSFICCSTTTNPRTSANRERFYKGRFSTRYYNPDIHTASFALPEFIKKQYDL